MSPLPLVGLTLTLVLVGCEEALEREGKDDDASVAPAGEGTSAWPMTRGGPELQGRILDPVPAQPEVLWTYEMKLGGVAEAAVVDETIYVGDLGGTVYAINMADQTLKWTFEAGGTILAAPAVAESMVLVASDDEKFYALDAGTGEKRWQVEGGDKFAAGGIVVPAVDEDGSWVLVNCYDGVAHCLRVKDGSEVWSHQTDDPLNGASSLVAGKLVVFGGCDAVIRALDRSSGADQHRIETEAQITNSGATWGSLVYCGNHASQVVAADVPKEEILWVYEGDDFPFVAAPAVDEKRVYIGARDKQMHAIDRETGQQAWTFRTGGRVESSPVTFADAVVFGSNDGRLYAVDSESGEERWKLDLGERLTAPPAFAGGRIVIAGNDGTVFVVGE